MGLCNDKGKSFLVSTEIRNIFLEVYKKKKKKKLTMKVYTYFGLVDNNVQTERIEIPILLFCYPIWGSPVKVAHLLFKTSLISILCTLRKSTFLVEI